MRCVVLNMHLDTSATVLYERYKSLNDGLRCGGLVGG